MISHLDLRRAAKNIEMIEEALNLSRREIFNLIDIPGYSNPHFENISWPQFVKFLHTFNLSSDNFFSGRFCLEALKNQFQGNPSFISPLLRGNEGTRMRTLDSALSFAGRSQRAHVLKTLQLQEEAFVQGDELVSVDVLDRVFSEIYRLYGHYHIFEDIGYLNSKKFFGSSLEKRDFSQRDIFRDFDLFINEKTEIVEKNMVYKITSMSASRITFDYRTKESLQDYAQVNHFGTPAFCHNIKGFMQGFVDEMSERPGVVHKTSCAHLGDSVCSYEIVFDSVIH